MIRTPPSSVHARVAEGRARLRAAGIRPPEADLDARLLAQHLLHWTAERFFTAADEPAPDAFASRYDEVVARRAAREPLAYIVGEKQFWGLTLEVSPDVLIPRPETEIIVEAALEAFPERDASLAIADVCTGCGCLAIALACERPQAHITATDISQPAVDVARRNTQRHGVAGRVRFLTADLFGSIESACDLIVANPPYVLDGDRRGLQPEVRDHEPDVALFGGVDGLRMIERLVIEAPARLRSGGWLIFEFGFGQDEHVERFLAASSELELTGLRRDLQGIARTAVAKRR